MRRIPMPSPRGTNHARLFINANPSAAYDAKLDEGVGADLVAFLTGKLSDADLAEFCKLAGIDAGAAMDSPEPFPGAPLPGGGFGQDARPRRIDRSMAADKSFAERFPHAARIRVSA